MMSVFVWGLCNHGQLGLGGIEDERIIVAKQLESDIFQNSKVREICCGMDHALILLENGSVYSCGSNEFGQLGRDGPCKRFHKIDAPEDTVITEIACGSYFNLCLSSEGKVLSWGCNDFGQLGRDNADQSLQAIDALKSNIIVQIACGASHSVCLTNLSEVFAWGSNAHGELGLGFNGVKIQAAPIKILSLHSIGIRQVACGGEHTLCLTVSGALYCWGRNNFGQLGLGDTDDRNVPHQCRSLKTQPVTHVSCGAAHTVILTRDSGVFTCGAGGCGQLGHNNKSNVLVPTKVFEFMSRDVAQIVCGRRHTMALILSTGRLMTFGLGASGQLGVGHIGDLLSPAPMKGPWIPQYSSSQVYERRLSIPDATDACVIHRAFSGHGDSCFIVAYPASDGIPPHDQRDTSSNIFINHLTEVDKSVLLNNSEDQGVAVEKVIQKLVSILSCIATTNTSFLTENHFNISSQNHGVDVDLCAKIFEGISKFSFNEQSLSDLRQAVSRLTTAMRQRNFPSAECLRAFLTIPQMIYVFSESDYNSFCLLYCKSLKALQPTPRTYIERWWSILPLRYLRKFVACLRNCILSVVRSSTSSSSQGATSQSVPEPVSSDELWACLDAFSLLFKANRAKETPFSTDVFYIVELNDIVDISAEYYHWLCCNRPNRESLCKYPFIFDGVAKSIMLQTDARLQMARAVSKARNSSIAALFNHAMGVEPPVLIFRINRDDILKDTVTNLDMVDQPDLKKPLKVIFVGEEAQDEGGVRKEYFMLLFRELMNPNYAMFKYYEESRMLWFHEHTFEDRRRFALVGTMCGLSIYNNSLVDLTFPLALYKKLLSRSVTLDDLKELDPTLGRSLQSLLDYEEPDVEDTFCLTFAIEMESFGVQTMVELKKDGNNIPVNSHNKEEYVDLYVDFVFNKSCEERYQAFHSAFHSVFANNSLLSLFEPAELQTMLVGNDDYDWSVLQKNTMYKGEYWKGHPVITWFWESLQEFSIAEKKKFLLFLTGSDRVPMQGMEAIKIFIQPNNAGDEHLPVAHTCFNLLDLPKYSSKEILSSKLKLAIEQTEGFALV